MTPAKVLVRVPSGRAWRSCCARGIPESSVRGNLAAVRRAGLNPDVPPPCFDIYYLCSGKGHSTSSHGATCCPARHTPAGQLDELVWDDLCALLGEPGEPVVDAVREHGPSQL